MYPQEYSKALGRTIAFRTFRFSRGGRRCSSAAAGYVVNHLAAIADPHRTERFDRISDEVLMLTGNGR